MDEHWQSEFRRRMNRFGGPKPDGTVPVSIKVRIESGCFHREHSPEAYRLIDEHLATTDLSDCHFQFEEHESGPEILVYMAVAAASLGFAKSIIELVTTIIKARAEGIKKGDQPSEPLVMIVRGHSKNGEYFEESILRIPHGAAVTPKQIRDALKNRKQPAQQKKKTRKKK
jgi:hypothetical protein